MGDRRFNAAFDRLANAADLPAAIRSAPDADLIAALAAASGRPIAPYFANVVATELQNRLHRKNSVLNTAGDGLVTIDEAGRITYVNPAVEQLTGLRLEQLRDRDGHDALGCDGHSHDACPLLAAARGGPSVRSVDLRMRRRDGSTFEVLATVEPFERDGVHEGAVLAFHDVTEHRRAERELEAERRLLESLHRALDELGEGIALTEQGRIVYANDAFLRLTGYEREELRAIEPLDLAPPEDRDRIFRETTRQLSGEAPPAPLEILLRRKDGAIVPAEISTRMVSDGEVRRVVTVVRDISTRRTAEESVLRSEARWRGLIEAVPGYIFTIDRDGVITYMSRAAPDASVDEIVGRNLLSYFVEADADRVQRAVEEVFESGKPREYDARGRTTSGMIRWHHARVAPLDVAEDGRPRAVLVLSLAIPPPEGRLPQRS